MNIEKIIFNSPYIIRFLAINFYGFLLSRRRFSKKFFRILDELNSNLNKSKEEVNREQFHLVKKNLIFCYEQIPYYKKLFNEVGFKPKNMNSLTEMQGIPYLTKDRIRENFDQLTNPSITKSDYQIHSTSGSTGQKLLFKLPKSLLYETNAAFIYRFYGIYGIKPKDKRVTIGGRKFTNKEPYWVVNYFENQLLVSSHHLQDENIFTILKRIEKFKPKFFQGHPNSIFRLATYVTKNSLILNINLKAIFTTGESLTESNRKIIQAAFNTRVYQQYGSGESCFSAQETKDQKNYLLNYEHGYVELIGDKEYKEVVVTSLQNNVMPFVRYKLGDYVLPSKQNQKYSKVPLPYLCSKVMGRIDDIVKDSKGNEVLPVVIRMTLKTFLKDGTNYQLIQIGKVNFNLILVDPKKELLVEEVMSSLKKILGYEICLEISYKDSLISDGGKIRNIINSNN